MHGVIKKMMLMGNLLDNHPHLVEVYTDIDFTFEKTSAKFYLLCERGFEKVIDCLDLYNNIINIFDKESNIYFAKSQFDVMLEHKKLIWRKGSWYL